MIAKDNDDEDDDEDDGEDDYGAYLMSCICLNLLVIQWDCTLCGKMQN